MSRKVFEVETMNAGEWNKVPGSMCWRYTLEGDALLLTNGNHCIIEKGAVRPGDIVFVDFYGTESTAEIAKVSRQPIRRLACQYGLTGACLEISPKFETYGEYVYFADADHFDDDCWATGGHQHRYHGDGHDDATHTDVKRDVIKRNGEFIAAAFERINGIQKWAVSSGCALEIFTEEEVRTLFESVGLRPCV